MEEYLWNDFLIRLQKKNQKKEEKDIKTVLVFLNQFIRAYPFGSYESLTW